MKQISQYLAVLPLVLGGITLSFVLAISVWSVTGSKSFFQTQSKASTEEVSLSFSQSSGSWKVGEDKTLGILLSTGTKSITGVDLTIKYDPTLINVDPGGVVPGNLLSQVLVKQAGNGKISFSAVTLTPGVKNGILLTIVAKALKTGKASLEFSVPSDVMEASSATNILNKTSAAQFDIQ